MASVAAAKSATGMAADDATAGSLSRAFGDVAVVDRDPRKCQIVRGLKAFYFGDDSLLSYHDGAQWQPWLQSKMGGENSVTIVKAQNK